MNKLKLSILFSMIVALGITGCGSSMYNYKVEPTPIKQENSKYVIKNVSLTLKHGHGRNINNKRFKTEDELRKSFEEFLKKELIEQSLAGDKNDFQVSIDINYKRMYAYGGNSLTKPEFTYVAKVYNSKDELLASFSIPKSTTKYSMLENIAVTAKIVSFQWDEKNEPQDIALISRTIIEDLSQLGD